MVQGSETHRVVPKRHVRQWGTRLHENNLQSALYLLVAGEVAFVNDKPLSDNPHGAGSVAYKIWRTGWLFRCDIARAVRNGGILLEE